MSKKDYYDILGLTTACTTQDVKKNYHKLALVWHPDKHTNKSEAQKKFTEIHEAYSILVDANKRQLYDRYGHQGLGEDSGLGGFGSPNRKNFFHEKGFAGTNKSAFEFLRDIFAENEEDDFLQSFDPFKISDTFQRTFKDFMEESSDNDEQDDNFFKSYIPTFMDTSFFTSPSLFQPFFVPETTETHTQFFQFFTSSMDSNTQSFSKTSSMFVNNGKIQTSTKQRMQKGDTVVENEESNEYMKQAHSLLFGNPADSKSHNLKSKDKKDSNIIIIEDNDSPVNPKSLPKKSKKPEKKENNAKAEHKELRKACRFFDFESLSDDNEGDFDLLGENGLNFRKKCSKKAKI